jgi:hypothetical protein
MVMTDSAYWNASPPARAKKANDPADAPLAVGDVVVLNSGGPAMTIERFTAPPPPSQAKFNELGFTYAATDMQAHAIWHSSDGHFLDRVFWPHTLMRVGGDRPRDEVVKAK